MQVLKLSVAIIANLNWFYSAGPGPNNDLLVFFLLQPVVCGNYSPQARTPNSKAVGEALIHRATAEG